MNVPYVEGVVSRSYDFPPVPGAVQVTFHSGQAGVVMVTDCIIYWNGINLVEIFKRFVQVEVPAFPIDVPGNVSKRHGVNLPSAVGCDICVNVGHELKILVEVIV